MNLEGIWFGNIGVKRGISSITVRLEKAGKPVFSAYIQQSRILEYPVKSGDFISCFPVKWQNKHQTDYKKDGDRQNWKTHAPGKRFDGAKTKCSGNGCQLLHHIVKTKKGRVVGGIGRKHFGVGASGKRLRPAHNDANEKCCN